MSGSTHKVFPDHIAGLLQFLSKPEEKANEDLALAYFRKAYPDTFTRQSEAMGADGYVSGHFVLELKGKTNSWLSGLFQGIAYNRNLDFSLIVVAAKEFLAVWRLSDIPLAIRSEILLSSGAASSLGTKFARKYGTEKRTLLKKALWRGDELFMELFASKPEIVLSNLKSFDETLRQAKKVRRSINPRNFITTLEQMSPYFDPSNPIKAVSAFYSMVYGWHETSVVEISQRNPDQATLGGEPVRSLIPGKRILFKEFVESRAVRLNKDESIDDFFSRYDKALDAVDKDFRIKHGIFFTDLDLSKFVLWLVKRHIPDLGKNYIVIDPACGSGNLVTNWRTPLELRHKVVSEIDPDLLFVVEKRMKGDQWHDGKFTVVPKVSEGQGLNFLDKSAGEYLSTLTKYLQERGHKPNKPLAFLCNPPYRSDDDQSAAGIQYSIHPSIVERIGNDASAERYCCFLAQMRLICKEAADSGLPGDPLLLLFTKTTWLTKRAMFQQLREDILSRFEDCGGVLVSAKQFFDVKGNFPIAFTVWRYVGENKSLDPSRPVPLTDLTWLTKKQLAGFSWGDDVAIENECSAILSSTKSITVLLGVDREPIKRWVGQKMTDFKRSRRKSELRVSTCGGLPKGDHRYLNKKVYGDSLGQNVGFMDDLTPCRTNKVSGAVPHFHLDPRFMRVRDYRCFSGHSDHYSYAVHNLGEARRLMQWYAIGRTFAERGYPMWADAMELWAPDFGSEAAEISTMYSLCICFAENECIETVFPANNPVQGAPEILIHNPMAPTNPNSFWCSYLEPILHQDGHLTAKRLADAVKVVYAIWRQRFRHENELYLPYSRPYFVQDGVLKITAGLVQIKDYAVEMNDQELLEALDRMKSTLRTAKDQFYEMLLDPNGLDYFGQLAFKRRTGTASAQSRVVSPDVFVPSSKFDHVLERRLAIVGTLINELANDPHLGRTKLAKVLYLADMSQKLNLEMNYYRQAAGPLDGRAMYNSKVGVEALGKRHKYFTVEEVRGRIRYMPSRNMPALLEKANEILGKKRNGVYQTIRLCRELNTEQSEIVATLFACWNDLLHKSRRVSDGMIITEFLTNWHPKKRRFSNDRLLKALGWMKKTGLTPSYIGSRTLTKS